MKQNTKPYKKSSKANKKVKRIDQSETGELATSNSKKRFPIVSLPEIITQPIFQSYRRFIASADTSGNLTIDDLLNQFMVATTSVLAIDYIKAVRIKKIRALSPVTTQGTSVFASMQPVGSDSGNNSFNSVPEVYIDTSASIDIPAYLSLTPSLTTPLGAWHYSNTTSIALLLMILPKGTTLDILFEFMLRTSEASQSPHTRVVAAATAGRQYAAAILTNLIPSGVNYI
jgi:hypothetical protein